MNWGRALALTMVAFAGMMAWFLVKAAQNPEPLITEHYYEQELGFQDRINACERAKALGEPVVFSEARDGVTLVFPKAVRSGSVIGELALLRLNDPRADRTLSVDRVIDGRFHGHTDLVPGKYLAQLRWHAGGRSYYSEAQLFVP